MSTTLAGVGLILTTIITIFLVFFKWRHSYWKRKNVPFLTPTIPLGNLENPFYFKRGFSNLAADFYNELKSKGHKHGGFYFITKPVYIPVDTDYIKNVLQRDFEHFVDRGLYFHEKADPMSVNLFNIEGTKWRKLRSKLTPTFTTGKIKSMFSTLLSCGEQLMDKIATLSSGNEDFDIKEIAGCFMTDVIGSVAFGLECNSFAEQDAEFRKYGRMIFQPTFDLVLRQFCAELIPDLCKFFKMRVFSKFLTTFFFETITNVIDYRENNNVQRKDFLQILMELKNNNSGNSITINEIAAQSFIFFFAGFETSSTALTFCFYELAKNQDIQDKVRREINDVSAKFDGNITYDGIMEMKYMGQVIDEALRKYPPVAILVRNCTKDYEIPNTDTVLEKGTQVHISVLGVHHDPEYYPNPDVFDPERFSAANKSKRPPVTFLPFGEGPRNCIGLRFGLTQVKVGLAMMLKDYRYTLNSKTPESVTFNPKSVVLTSNDPIILNVQKI